MKFLLGRITFIAWLAVASFGAEQATNSLLLGWHFAGGDGIRKQENLKTLNEVWNLPESESLRGKLLDHFADYAAKRARTNQAALLVRPMLEHLLQYESIFELRGQSPDSMQWGFAVKIPESKRNVWKENLRKLASLTELGAPQVITRNDIKGQKWGKNEYNLYLVEDGDWIVVSGGEKSEPSTLATFKDTGKPFTESQLLILQADLPGLARWNRRTNDALPQVALEASGRAENVRSEMKLRFAESTKLQVTPWKIPTNTIRAPLASLTAIQGIAPLLDQQPWFKSLGIQPSPNQLFIWSEATTLFSFFAAWETKNRDEILASLAEKVPQLNTNLQKRFIGQAEFNTRQEALIWRGLPVIVPFLKKAQDENFMVAGLFPTSNPSTNPPPQELMQQLLNRKDLFYYDWEVTESRLAQIRPISQLKMLATGFDLPSPNSIALRWLLAIQPRLGNTITEGTLSGDKELTLSRKSHIGFNSLELWNLAHWIESEQFPHAPKPKAPTRLPMAPVPAP
ncbi:MAG: hypothetical protein SFY81_08765 [Verrucomicrobiota bacterium]|nr:hypothetical protein [Verrucomicrobiota bacterium]